MSNLLPPGNYPAKTNAKMVVYEADSGSLCVAVPLAISGEIAWSGKTTITLGNADGVINTRAIGNLKKCFLEWDSTNPFALEEIEPGQNDLEIVGEHDTYTPKATDEEPDPQPVTFFKVKWLNPPSGGGATMKEPLGEAERKKVLTKWGSKFKASATPSSKPTPASKTTPAKPAAKSGPPTPPSRKSARTSSQEEVWTLLKKANPEGDDDVLTKKYYDAQDEVAPGMNGELTSAQWGAVAVKLEV